MATTATAMRCGWIRFVPLHLCTYICRDNIRGSCVHNSLPLCEGDYDYTAKSVLYFSLAIFCVRFIFFYPASLLLTISFALAVCVRVSVWCFCWNCSPIFVQIIQLSGLQSTSKLNVCNPTKIRTHFVFYICKMGTCSNTHHRPKHRKIGIIIMAEILMAPT